MTPDRHRAKPLPPGDRRQETIATATPLLLEQGSELTSNEMAEAAGVAKCTIFSVFPDLFQRHRSDLRVEPGRSSDPRSR